VAALRPILSAQPLLAHAKPYRGVRFVSDVEWRTQQKLYSALRVNDVVLLKYRERGLQIAVIKKIDLMHRGDIFCATRMTWDKGTLIPRYRLRCRVEREPAIQWIRHAIQRHAASVAAG
jgi:hypothetical protein